MPSQMLIFTIGPVQPFIAQARKTRDLWVGSFLLSKLMEAAMEQFVIEGQEEPSPELIFPAHPRISGKIPDLPNKFVAILADEAEARKAAGRAELLLAARWREIADKVWGGNDQDWKGLEKEVPSIRAAQGIWDRQIQFESFFEIYWAIAPEPSGRKDAGLYGKWCARAQQALDARKRLRNFRRQEEAERGEKSTISGERQALHGGAGDLQSIKAFWTEIAAHFPEAQISHYGSERLDAIDTIKRFAAKAKPIIPDLLFPSTSTVAAAPFIAELLKKGSTSPALNTALEEWQTLTAVGNRMDKGAHRDSLPYLAKRAGSRRDLLRRDGDSFFLETYTPERLAENYGFPHPNPSKRAEERPPSDEEQRQREEKLQQMRKLVSQAPAVLGALRREAANAKIQPLSPYYAVLAMDGDHMGTLLSKVEDEEEHHNISRALSTFAREVAPPKVEETYPAKLVYTGGDDVLAMAPMRHVLDLSKLLQKAYIDTMEASTARLRERTEKEGKPLEVTMSAGIAIAHYLDPLSHVLREARRAEETAKERYGRNAVVVTLLRRSGEPTTVGCKWLYAGLAEGNQPLKLFEEIRDLLERGALSRKFVYNLAEEAAIIALLAQPERGERSPQESEIERLLTRGRQDKTLLPDEQIASLAKRLALLAKEMNPREENGTKKKQKKAGEEQKPDEVDLWRPGPRRGLVEISGWLLLMGFTLRGGTD